MLDRIKSKIKNFRSLLNIRFFFALLASLVFLIPTVFWGFTYVFSYPAKSDALELAKNNSQVEIVKNFRYYKITPKDLDSQNLPIVYYTGGLVKPEAYLYQATELASFLQTEVYLSRPVFNVMIFEFDLADHIRQENDLQKIRIGGHSLGGISACRFAKDNPEKIQTLFLLASYCDQDLSDLDLEVVSIMGKRDGIINRENYEKAKQNLPESARIVEDARLNHSDFGNYGLQRGDLPSRLETREVMDLTALNLSL